VKDSDSNSELLPDNGEQQPRGFMAWLRHAFAIEEFSEASLSEDEKAVLQEIARIVHRRGMSTPAILWFESHRHLNFAGSQVVKMLEPIHDISFEFVRWLMEKLGVGYITPEQLTKFQSALEKRYSIEYLLQQIERQVVDNGTKSANLPPGTGSKTDPADAV
jgi:hypothetical protein